MIELYEKKKGHFLDKKQPDLELFLTFKDLKDFNRYAKKWMSSDFKRIINNDESNQLKIFMINHALYYTSFKIKSKDDPDE